MKIVVAETTRPKTGRKIIVRSTVALVAVVALAGCSKMAAFNNPKPLVAASVEERHPIRVTNRSVAIKLPVDVGAYGLTGRQKRKVRRFLAGYKNSGDSGRIVVAAPSGGQNEAATFNALRDLRSVMLSYRISRGTIAFRPYHAGRNPNPSIKLSYGRYVAEGPECGDWPENLAEDKLNQNYSNFGCASQRNLAAMIANPRDLVRPRGETPRYGGRRDVVFEKYTKGDTTVSQKSEDESGAVSDVAK